MPHIFLKKLVKKIKTKLSNGFGSVGRAVASDTSGQYYKQFTIVIYGSRGVLNVKLLIFLF